MVASKAYKQNIRVIENMDTDKVIQDLSRRFAAPLPEFYRRRIIFWYDEDGEFADKLDEIILTNAKLVTLTGRNGFAVKKLLANDDGNSNFLVYCPISYEKPEDNWLIDIALYSEEFRADLISIWMDEMGISSTPAMRKQVKAYRKFMGAKDRRNRIMGQNVVPSTPAQLHMAVMAALCGIKTVQPGAIIRAVLGAGLDMDANGLYSDFVSFGAKDAFWVMVSQGCGYHDPEPNLSRFATHLLLTAASRTMRTEYLSGLEAYISIPHQAYCYDLVFEWLHSEQVQQVYELARFVEEKARLYQRFEKLPLEALLGTECFPCIHEVILVKLMSDISNHLIEVDAITAAVEKRRTCVWYEWVENYYQGILQVAKMQNFYKEHSAGFHTADPQGIWKEYTDTYYKMDSYYREFHLAFQKTLERSNHLLDDLFKQVAEKVEGQYIHWFLDQLGSNWSCVCAEQLQCCGKLEGIPQQRDFYRIKVRDADSRIFVIISDALRYEVAVSLSEQMQREMQGKVTLGNMQSVFPSITKFGMAALLPHKELSVEMRGDVLTVLADGQSTASTNRDKVLKAANSNSVALQFKEIVGMKRAERSALVKGMDVVYIYHDTIDEASHHSDSAVFQACEKAISEIKNLIRIIVNDFGGSNVIVTADHGFLYTYSPLSEEDKVDQAGFNGLAVDCGRRHAIMRKGAAPEYLLPIKFLDGTTEFEGFAPRECVRIKIKGGGLNFVHGGISLQEMVVPVVEYRHLRNDSKEYLRNKQKYDTKPVSVSLLSSNRKISNMIFSLNFYQTEAVCENREKANYLVYFTDESGVQISDVQKIIADKTSTNNAERTFRCNFNLKSLKYDKMATYYLVIADEQGLQMPQREEFQIDIAFAVEEFDFFS